MVRDSDRSEIIRTLVEAGADADAQNDRGATALHLAALGLCPPLVATLLGDSQHGLITRA